MIQETERVEILLIDDHTLFREGLRRMLESDAGLGVCGDFATADQALAAVNAGLEFDVALVDYDLLEASGRRTNGLDLIEQLRVLRPGARVLIVTGGMQSGELVRAVQKLNAGVFFKAEPTAELKLAILRTAQGEQWVSSGAALKLAAAREAECISDRQGPKPLTERESRVLRGVLEGETNKEIGARLEMSESMVKAVLQRLFEKSGVRTRSQLVRYAIESQVETK
jgi:DNA-binding NarL/FixJ family response regulator